MTSKITSIPLAAVVALLAAGEKVSAHAQTSLLPSSPMTSKLAYYNPDRMPPTVKELQTDVCIYGGNSAGVAAALQVARSGKKAIVLEPSSHLGGLSASGLGETDIGNKAAIGGIAREFYKRIGQKYGMDEEWRFEPRIAEQVFQEMLAEAKAPVYYRQFLSAVKKERGRLLSITMENGLTIWAKMFIDATYEGDLMAKAGVSYTVGREANAQYGESINGVQVHKKHQFDLPVSPYRVEGDPSSGLLPGINPGDPGASGSGDKRIQAYNFRLCLTIDPDNRIPFEKPAEYNPEEYVLLSRYLQAGWPASEVFRKFDPIHNSRNDELGPDVMDAKKYLKVDKNNHGAISTDYIGQNYDYPEASYAKREQIFQAHVTYVKGLMWFMGNDPTVPEPIRTRWNTWGLAKDEFLETGGWPHQLYVREARRMVSDYVMTEANCRGKDVVPDAVGLAAYTMDSHNVQRFVKDGRVWNEGDVQATGFPPYPISYRSIVPKKSQCDNLFVPVCLSASHIAYGSIRMEPVFMILGQSAAYAASSAIDRNLAVQDVPYSDLKPQLQAGQQVLVW